MINKKLLSDITSYCVLNNLDLEVYINKLLKDAFLIDKYGSVPQIVKEEVKKPKKVKPEKKINEVKEEIKEVVVSKKGKDLYGDD